MLISLSTRLVCWKNLRIGRTHRPRTTFRKSHGWPEAYMQIYSIGPAVYCASVSSNLFFFRQLKNKTMKMPVAEDMLLLVSNPSVYICSIHSCDPWRFFSIVLCHLLARSFSSFSLSPVGDHLVPASTFPLTGDRPRCPSLR